MRLRSIALRVSLPAQSSPWGSVAFGEPQLPTQREGGKPETPGVKVASTTPTVLPRTERLSGAGTHLMNATPSLTARRPIMGADGATAHPQTGSPSSRTSAPTTTLPGAPEGAPSKRTNQRCHHHRHIQYSSVSGDPLPTLPPIPLAQDPDPGNNSRQGPRVSGWGPQAHAALVDALRDAGETTVSEEVMDCGLIPLPAATHVTVHSRGDGCRHMGGLTHCGRFQLCPNCTPFLMAQRLEALEVIGRSLAKDERLRHFQLVISLRHHLGANWKALVHALRKMQAAVRRGHRWRAVVQGFARLLESTYGKHGHHPHEHILIALRASKDFDAEAFFLWVREVCELNARKAGRSCDFTDGWWSEVPRGQLSATIGYFGRTDKMGTSGSNPLSEFSSSTKHQPLWCIPPRVYAQVWRGSYRMRWFGVGGCWKSSATDKSDEEVEQERQETGTVIAHIAREVWKAWTPRERRDRRAVIYDRALTDPQAVTCVVAWGGVAGPPPIPDWGEGIPFPSG